MLIHTEVMCVVRKLHTHEKRKVEIQNVYLFPWLKVFNRLFMSSFSQQSTMFIVTNEYHDIIPSLFLHTKRFLCGSLASTLNIQ